MSAYAQVLGALHGAGWIDTVAIAYRAGLPLLAVVQALPILESEGKISSKVEPHEHGETTLYTESSPRREE